ncbi:hypothetical protein BASA50_006775 [Batrachochytrium salamandrivorans]|uniref:Roadblock/LAMTOR2 domain-containing protein n=1 Tax=Batrachochytrium salamandrivorans TaxID=1357716 RepID=A0ABQ8F920_9FUNG|nr:hypothetical protein BASA62_001411 [Batrachochytrium salamandrivorans]KAH6580169.1 hypothetical protein BASA60_002986 [Batrachochytrium salamandrivorans]KAH6590531.1 hypothetical protein BASA61_005290 [Batrachochytrium salamandrivorans]KAH6594304.1 hypothetical protein BASA50_006775 [Batrachochytrium salamandrivorans]KAH9270014.1 hypothetical protein BASA83_007843 [Batrachochytrium salamandrivorans]
MSQIENELQQVLNRATEDLLAIIITDKDGVVILKATRPDLPGHILEPAFTASFLLTSDQMSKIGFGKTNKVISVCGRYCIAQSGVESLILTLIAAQNANLGIMIDIGNDLRSAVEEVSRSCSSGGR